MNLSLGWEMIKLLKNTLKFNIYKDYPIIASFSTKNGGVSQDCYQSMNLSFTTGDKRDNVLQNYQIFANEIDVDFNKMVLSSQQHNDNILIATSDHAGMGVKKNKSYADIDGIYTEQIGLPIITGHADCTPIFFYDKKRHAIGLVHSGWRGTAKEIVKKMTKLFKAKGSNTEDILCVIGPAICYDCYEVGEEVVSAMPTYCHLKRSVGKPHIDLKDINRQILIYSGILSEHIEVSNYCTKCHSDLFFSHRRLGNKRGAQAACMCLI